MEGRSSRTREAAWRYSTAIATAVAAGNGARNISPAASATSGRRRLPGERTASSIARESAGARAAGAGRARDNSRPDGGRPAATRRTAPRGPAAGPEDSRLGEACHRLRLGLVNVEDRNELSDGQHVVDLRRQMEELQLPALVRDGGVAPDQLADPRRIDRRDVVHVDHDVLLAPLHEMVDRLPQLHVAGADRDLPLEVHDLHAARSLAYGRLHQLPSFCLP